MTDPSNPQTASAERPSHPTIRTMALMVTHAGANAHVTCDEYLGLPGGPWVVRPTYDDRDVTHYVTRRGYPEMDDAVEAATALCAELAVLRAERKALDARFQAAYDQYVQTPPARRATREQNS